MLMLLIVPQLANAATVTRVDRAIHDGFELLILHCDSLPEFSLEYNRVAGVAELRLKRGKIGRKAAQTLLNFRSGVAIRGATVDQARGVISFRTPTPVHLREYMITGPSALILDFGTAEQVKEPLPFELDREGYLKLGSKAERGGQLELALGYVDHVRGWEGSDLSLTHRAGVIEQRLGRWDQALETLGESAQIAEFAADAHARRTMIFLAKGDTASMGEEWAGYFHNTGKKKPIIEAPAPELNDTTTIVAEPPALIDTTTIVAEPPPAHAEPPANKLQLKLPKILSAGGGNSLDYLYYGWGFLAAGFLSLIGLLLSAKKNSLNPDNFHPIDISIPEPHDERPRREPLVFNPPVMKPVTRSEDLRHSAESFQSAIAHVEPQPRLRTLAERQPPRLEQPHHNPMTGLYPKPKPNPAQQLKDRVPVDEIVSLAAGGMSESDIAHKLSVGRDEVAMVKNLARLSRRPPPSRDD